MAMNLEISVPPELEEALKELARQKGLAPEDLVVDALRIRLASAAPAFQPRDDWERLILQAGTNCGVSPPDEAFSDLFREG